MFNPGFPQLGPAGDEILGEIITNTLDPQLGYMWEVRIESSDAPRDYERNIQMYARNCTLPQRSVEEINRYYMGEVISDAGHKNDPKQLRVTFWDDKRLIGYRYFNEWINMASDPQFGRQASKTFLKRNVKIRLKDRSDFFLGLEIELKGSYLFNIGDVTLSYDESIPFMYNVGIKYSDMIINGVDYSINANQQLSGGDIITTVNRTLNRAKDSLLDRFS